MRLSRGSDSSEDTRHALCTSSTCPQATTCIPSQVLSSSRQKLKACLLLGNCFYLHINANTPPTVSLNYLLLARGKSLQSKGPRWRSTQPCSAVGRYCLSPARFFQVCCSHSWAMGFLPQQRSLGTLANLGAPIQLLSRRTLHKEYQRMSSPPSEDDEMHC